MTEAAGVGALPPLAWRCNRPEDPPPAVGVTQRAGADVDSYEPSGGQMFWLPRPGLYASWRPLDCLGHRAAWAGDSHILSRARLGGAVRDLPNRGLLSGGIGSEVVAQEMTVVWQADASLPLFDFALECLETAREAQARTASTQPLRWTWTHAPSLDEALRLARHSQAGEADYAAFSRAATAAGGPWLSAGPARAAYRAAVVAVKYDFYKSLDGALWGPLPAADFTPLNARLEQRLFDMGAPRQVGPGEVSP